MGEIRVKDRELKALLRFAKNKPVNFAFNPGKDKANHYFGAHRKLAPKKLEKTAKEEGDGKKVAFGTFQVDGKLMVLTCERAIPKLAKDVKHFLKTNKIRLNVQILNENGNILEADIEDLPDDDELGDAQTEASDTPEDTGAGDALRARLRDLQQALSTLDDTEGAVKLAKALKLAGAMLAAGQIGKGNSAADQIEARLAKLAKNDGAASEIDPEALRARLGTLAAQVKALDNDAGAKLRDALQKVVEAFRAVKLPAAAKGADQIEAALTKLMAASEPTEAPAPEQDENAEKALKAVEVMQSRGQALAPKTAQEEFLADVAQARALVEAGQGTDALAALRDLQTRLKELEAAPPESTTPEDGPTGDELAWFQAMTRLESAVNAALTGGLVIDVEGLRKDWNWATAEAGDQHYAEALAKIPAIEAYLADRHKEGKTAFSEEIGDEVKPFATARLTWNKARSTMRKELGKLQDAIVQDCTGDEELQGYADTVNDLIMHISDMDERLEVALDKIVNAGAPDARSSLKTSAIGVLDEFENQLTSPFFQAVDDNNGFTKVSVAATARKALNDIGKVLRG